LRRGLVGHEPDRNELLLKRAQRSNDLTRLIVIMANDTSKSSFFNSVSHLEKEEVFGFAKWPTNCPPSVDNDFHCPHHVNLSSPRIAILAVQPNIVRDVSMQQPPFGSSLFLPLVSWGGLELKESICVHGQWQIERCPPSSTFQKTTRFKCKTNSNLYKSVSGNPTPCYWGFWVQFHSRSLKHNMHWFYFNDLNHYVGGTTWKYVVVRPLAPIVWPIQEGTNLIQKEVITLRKNMIFFWLQSCSKIIWFPII
jgi:hypothetical protein